MKIYERLKTVEFYQMSFWQRKWNLSWRFSVWNEISTKKKKGECQTMQSHHQWKTSKLAFLLFKSITANIKKEKIFPVLGLSMSRYFSIMQQTISYICAHQLSRWRGEMNMCRQVQNLASRQFRQRNSWSFGGRRHNTDPLWNPLLSLSPASTYMFFQLHFFCPMSRYNLKETPNEEK